MKFSIIANLWKNTTATQPIDNANWDFFDITTKFHQENQATLLTECDQNLSATTKTSLCSEVKPMCCVAHSNWSYLGLLHTFFSVKQSPLFRSVSLVLINDAVKTLPEANDLICFYKSQVCSPRFDASKLLILFKNRWQTPILQFPQATDKATCAMLHEVKTRKLERL